MLGLAGMNRQNLLPCLLGSAGPGQASVALRKLVQSAPAETAMGLAIVCIASLLGIMPPATEVATRRH